MFFLNKVNPQLTKLTKLTLQFGGLTLLTNIHCFLYEEKLTPCGPHNTERRNEHVNQPTNICPLMCIAGEGVCIKERCAWWLWPGCAITSIAESLGEEEPNE